MLSENGINSSHQKDNFLITTNHSIADNLNNNNLNNLNSYAKSTTITTSSSSPSQPSSSIQSTSTTTPTLTGHHHFHRQSPPMSSSLERQLRIYIPNYDDFIDTIRSQQPHSSRAGGSGMSSDIRRNMNDRRMMDRQSVSIVMNLISNAVMVHNKKWFELWVEDTNDVFFFYSESLRVIFIATSKQWHDGQSFVW